MAARPLWTAVGSLCRIDLARLARRQGSPRRRQFRPSCLVFDPRCSQFHYAHRQQVRAGRDSQPGQVAHRIRIDVESLTRPMISFSLSAMTIYSVRVAMPKAKSFWMALILKFIPDSLTKQHGSTLLPCRLVCVKISYHDTHRSKVWRSKSSFASSSTARVHAVVPGDNGLRGLPGEVLSTRESAVICRVLSDLHCRTMLLRERFGQRH